MDIFIDESGIFSNPNNKDHYVCCQAGLIIPEVKTERVFREYTELISRWERTGNEIKGSQLSEEQAAAIISLLSKYRVIVCVVAIDMGLHKDDILSDWKIQQANKFVEHLTSNHHPNVKKQLHELRDKFKELPNQLFVQAILFIELVALIIQTSTLYFCQRIFHTLQRFNWIIDAKDISITEYESIWEQIVCPILQTKSFKEPLNCLEGGNYKYFERFYYPSDKPPDYLKPFIQDEENFETLNVKKIMHENLSFKDSQSEIGLQIIDNIVTTLRRAFNGKLGLKRWEYLGELMIYDKRGTVKMISLDPELSHHKAPYYHVIEQIKKHAQPIIEE